MAIIMSDLEHVAGLSKFELTEEQREYALSRISALLNCAQQLQEVNTADVEPTTHVLRFTNVFRDDNPAPCLPQVEALALAPEHEGGYFKVPSIL